MLGGFEETHPADLAESKAFLDIACPKGGKRRRALDCGAGIGRITKTLLLPLYETVDMVDCNQRFLDQADKFISPGDLCRVTNRFCCGLQDFKPRANHYDLVWVQWVTGYLRDGDLVAFLQRCLASLARDNPHARLVVKDNCFTVGKREFDQEDSSVTRTRSELLPLFAQAGAIIRHEELQKSFPAALMPVRMFSMSPA